jgi:hypothetical protein
MSSRLVHMRHQQAAKPVDSDYEVVIGILDGGGAGVAVAAGIRTSSSPSLYVAVIDAAVTPAASGNVRENVP